MNKPVKLAVSMLPFLHCLCIARLLVLLYLVGPRFLIPGINTFFHPLTDVSIAASLLFSLLGISARKPISVILDHFMKILLVNWLVVEEKMNPYLYSLLVIEYSFLGASEHYSTLLKIRRRGITMFEKRLITLGRVLLFPVVSVTELILLFNGLQVVDAVWLKVLIVCYVPARFYFGKLLVKRLL